MSADPSQKKKTDAPISSKNPWVFAEDLGEEDLDVLCGICGEVFDSPPANGFVFGEIARRIRVDLDKKLQARGWCVVVGRSFGAFITQKIKSYAFISVYPGVSILVWKA